MYIFFETLIAMAALLSYLHFYYVIVFHIFVYHIKIEIYKKSRDLYQIKNYIKQILYTKVMKKNKKMLSNYKERKK